MQLHDAVYSLNEEKTRTLSLLQMVAPLERHLSRMQTVCRRDAVVNEIDAVNPSLLLLNGMVGKDSLYCASALQRLQPDPTEWETWCSGCSGSPLQPSC